MTTSSSLNLVEAIPCFGEVNAEAMKRLLSSMKEQSFARGEIILVEGEPCPGLFVVKSGAIKLYHISVDGEEHIVRTVRRGGCFECVPLFDGGANPVSAQALEASTVYLLPALEFDLMLGTYPQVALNFTPVLARRLRSLVGMVGDFSMRRVYPRLARLLSQLSEEQGKTMLVSPSLSLSQQHLACMLGCSRQVVNSSLRKLVREGIINMERRNIIILKPEALKEIA